MKVVVDKDKCTGCGKCREMCPKGFKIWNIGPDKKAEASNLRFCHVCTICAGVCPTKAIQVIRDREEDEKEGANEENL